MCCGHFKVLIVSVLCEMTNFLKMTMPERVLKVLSIISIHPFSLPPIQIQDFGSVSQHLAGKRSIITSVIFLN